MEKKYLFLKHILIEKPKNQDDILNVRLMFDVDDFHTLESSAFYEIETTFALDKVISTELGESIQDLIEMVGRSTSFKMRPCFIADFKEMVGPKAVSVIEKMGVDLNKIEKKLNYEGYAFLFRETLRIIIDINSSKKSTSYAVASLDKIIEKLRPTFSDVLDFIVIDKSRYNEGIDAVDVKPDINFVNPRTLGKAIREIIKEFQDLEKDYYEKTLIVKNLKNQLGPIYYKELENIGTNLHLLEMRFS